MQIELILTGTKYYRGFPCLDLGGEVRIEFDEGNEHSNNAFGVFTVGGLQIGSVAENPRYIPRVMTSDITKLSPELKELLNDGYTIDKAVCSKIRNNMAVIEVTLNNPSPIEEMESEEMSIEVIGNKEGLYTLVGVQHYRDNVEIGSKVLLTLKNNTTFGVDENGGDIGVFPQKDTKCAQVEELGLPLKKNSEIKQDGVAFEREYIVVGFITTTKGNKVSKYAVIQLKSVVEQETEAEPVTTENEVTDEVISLVTMLQSTNRGLLEAEEVIEQTTVDEVSVEAETEAEMEVNEMEVSEILANDVTLKQWVAERNELINKVSDLNEKLKKAEEELEYTEAKIGERVEAMTLIHQIKEKLSSMEIEELREIHNKFIDDGASSNEEDTTSSSNNEKTNDNGVDNWETETFENALNEIKKYDSLEQLHRDCGNPNTIIGKIALDIENMNLEAVIKTGYVHKRHMDKLEDVQIAELNMAIHRQEKILKGIIEE